MIHVTVAVAMIAKILLDALVWLVAMLALGALAVCVVGGLAFVAIRRMRR